MRTSTHPPSSRITSPMTTRSPIFTARPRLRLGFCHTPSLQRMTSASINPLPQGIHSAAITSAVPFLTQNTALVSSWQGFVCREGDEREAVNCLLEMKPLKPGQRPRSQCPTTIRAKEAINACAPLIAGAFIVSLFAKSPFGE